jgi:hypothetical protein
VPPFITHFFVWLEKLTPHQKNAKKIELFSLFFQKHPKNQALKHHTSTTQK